MKTIKEAADSLLSKGEITKDEYDYLDGKDIFNKEAGFFSGILKDITLKEKMVRAALTYAGLLAGKEAIYDPIKSNININKSFKLMSE